MKAAEYDQWYETPRGRWIGQTEIALLRDALQPRAGESLLDIGCGTGYFTRALSRYVPGPWMGVDINEEWVEYARSLDSGQIEYRVADAMSLPLEDKSFDLATSVTSLCFVADKRAAVCEMIRVARRRIVMGLLNRNSLLWRQEGRTGGTGAYQGAYWHTAREARRLFDGLPVRDIRVASAIHIPSGGILARALERLLPPHLTTGAFLLVSADLAS